MRNTKSHDDRYLDKMKKRAAEKSKDDGDQKPAAKPGSDNRLKLTAGMNVAMETLTGQHVSDAEPDDEDF